MDERLRKAQRESQGKLTLDIFRQIERTCPGHCLHQHFHVKVPRLQYPDDLYRCCHCGLYFLMEGVRYDHGKYATRWMDEIEHKYITTSGHKVPSPHLGKVEYRDDLAVLLYNPGSLDVSDGY